MGETLEILLGEGRERRSQLQGIIGSGTTLEGAQLSVEADQPAYLPLAFASSIMALRVFTKS